MQPNLHTAYQSTALSGSRHKVLRNTYALLGLSMIPTVIGAAVGANMNFAFMAGSPIMSMIAILAIFYGLTFAIEANRNNALGVPLMLLFTLLMGVLLGPLLQAAFKLANGSQLIMVAGGATTLVFAVMAGIATTTKRDLSGMGKFLMVGAIVLTLRDRPGTKRQDIGAQVSRAGSVSMPIEVTFWPGNSRALRWAMWCAESTLLA